MPEVYLVERRLKVKLDVLSDWVDSRNTRGQRLDMVDVAIFGYIDRLDCSRSAKVGARRDGQGRPWVDLGTLARAIPLLRLKPYAIARRIGKMTAIELLDSKAINVVVSGFGPRRELHACPSLRYRTLEERYAEDEGRQAARRVEKSKQSRARA